MIYLDQPVGTGFSFSTENDERELAHDEISLRKAATEALRNFFERHPKYKGSPFFIFGESFAGHMGSNIAYEIVNAKGFPVELSGLAIGDGWVDPVSQNEAFPEYAWATGLIDVPLRDELRIVSRDCAALIHAKTTQVHLIRSATTIY